MNGHPRRASNGGIRVRTETLARQFDRVLSVLRELGYVDGWSVTDRGGASAHLR